MTTTTAAITVDFDERDLLLAVAATRLSGAGDLALLIDSRDRDEFAQLGEQTTCAMWIATSLLRDNGSGGAFRLTVPPGRLAAHMRHEKAATLRCINDGHGLDRDQAYIALCDRLIAEAEEATR